MQCQTKLLFSLNFSQIIQLIDAPGSINQDDLTNLSAMIKEFPYCNTFHSLYLKGLQNTESIYFEKQLAKTSILSADRNKLYQLCYQSTLKSIIESVEEVVNLDQTESKDEKSSAIESTLEPEIVDETIQQEKITKDALLQALEEDILLEAINQSIQLDVEVEVKAINEEEITEIENNKVEIIEAKEESKTFSSPKKLSDWLSIMQPIDAVNNNETLPKTKKLASPQSLIDQFLKLEDKTIKVKKDPITPQQMAKMSLVENEDFVTETLANIYASQGNFLKSIKIYEQLMLTIPEKKVFFASRIRFLKEKMEYEQ